jgi:hypothetical protein
MSRIASFILSALLALCASPSLAQGAPPSEALVDRFMAALPPDRRALPTAPSAEEVERLEALNPGKSAEIRPILEAYQACAAAESKTQALALLRDVARALGEAKLLRLTSFYEGPDYLAFAALGDRISKGADVSAAEKAEFERLVAEYPLNDFRDTMMKVAMDDAAKLGASEKFAKCSAASKQAFDRNGLRFE